MFTGIVTDCGEVRSVSGDGDRHVEITTAYDTTTVDIGASICCSGACLTVTKKGAGWFAAMVSGETLSKTTLGFWTAGTPVNLERALRVGDELGGHIVSGHVDGVAELTDLRPEGDSHRLTFRAPADLMRMIAPKGSVTLDGVSLTVNEAEGATFGVNVISHTFAVTTFGRISPGDRVNLEVDMLARYVARLLGKE